MARVLRREAFTPQEIEDIRTLSTRENMRKLGIRKWQLSGLLANSRLGSDSLSMAVGRALWLH